MDKIMSKFTYSSKELELNKVIKLNQNESKAMLTDENLIQSRQNADSNIEASIALLKSLGRDREVQEVCDNISKKGTNIQLDCDSFNKDWNTLLSEADKQIPQTVFLEDILTKDEIQSVFNKLNEINSEFSRKTSIINKTDLSFLTIATALQVVKSLIFPLIAEKFDYGNSFDPENRLDHNDSSIKSAEREAKDKFKNKHLKRHGKGAWIEILFQSVPYDITKGSKDIGINMGGKYHRMYTLGHDPILGWLFGTANILTDCITFNTFQTNRISRIDPVTGAKKMRITPETVPLNMMFEECYEAAKADRLNLPAALFAQAQHFKSDKFTKLGLPVPILSSVNENFASKLYQEHYDALCLSRDTKIIGVSFVVSKLIDIIICLTHSLFRREDESKEQFEVRTRKILLISNSIASTSSIINTAITKNPKNLDIGGLLNTVTHLFSDIRFIARIKQEFIESQFESSFKEIKDEIDTLYKSINEFK